MPRENIISGIVDPNCIVNSNNEWDLLEEVIVGRVEEATICESHIQNNAVIPEKMQHHFREKTGEQFPKELIRKGAEELDNFAKILEAEGVTVRRPEVNKGDFNREIVTPDFSSPSQLYAAMPRDILITFGNTIVEAPMAWRSRFFEQRPFRTLIKDYFRQGAKWVTAPKPQMSDQLYDQEWTESTSNKVNFVTTEFEPVFDAADFTRIGKDIFAQRSQVTNDFGIEWMRRQLGPAQTVHVLDFRDKNAMHIDGTFAPLGPGKLLINPKRPCITGSTHSWQTYQGEKMEQRLPEMFKGWDVFVAPKPELSDDWPLQFTSPWTATCNIIMLDEKRVCVEASEKNTFDQFKKWGFDPIKVPFRHFLPFGGSFHCATCDIRRKGELKSYF